MADYYPLLSRALDALPDRSPALRKAVYDRARSALIGQLRSLEPPIPESDIDIERKALDAAIARLEVDYGEPPPAVAEPPPPKPVEPPPPPPKLEPAADPFAGEAVASLPGASVPPPPPVPVETKPSEVKRPAEGAPFVPRPRKPAPAESPAEPPPLDLVEMPAPANDAVDDDEPAADGRDQKRPRIEVVAPRAGRSHLLRNAIIGAVLLSLMGLIAVAAYTLRDQPSDLPDPTETTEEAPSETPEAKFADRVDGGEAPAEAAPQESAPATPPAAQAQPNAQPNAQSPAQPDVLVAQRAILYEENTSDPKAQPSSAAGRVTWRLEPVSGEQGQPLQSAVRANVEFPDSKLTLVMTIRKNFDLSLPASHTIELAFDNGGNGDTRSVQEIGLLQLKDDTNGRGSPISGLPVRVRDNLFLIGLSNLSNDLERNTDMLLRKNALDLAVKYKSGQRAMLAFDKGSSGTQVMQDAFNQWKQ